uniref:Uncharacterized protein n=1 Tax=Oryza meridionalis TaxID=40149 RepID=A0A0E0DIN0_9ORYZ
MSEALTNRFPDLKLDALVAFNQFTSPQPTAEAPTPEQLNSTKRHAHQSQLALTCYNPATFTNGRMVGPQQGMGEKLIK